MINVKKRTGEIVNFDQTKITNAILKAMKAADFESDDKAEGITEQVVSLIKENINESNIVSIEEIQNYVETVLMDNKHFDVAKEYIIYRAERAALRNNKNLVEEVGDLFDKYLDEADWRVKENSNMSYSINGLNNYVREKFTAKYWLHKVYPERIRNAHLEGKLHIHDLGFFGPYCAGWDCQLLIAHGFGGVSSKPEFSAPKHLRTFLGQVVNSTFTTQGESAGAQAWSSIDTYAAPFIRYDKLTYQQVKQCVQEYVCQMNVPTRVGFQCPFSNQTHDIKCPSTMVKKRVIIDGQFMEECYGDFQEEMDMFNKAFCEVMEEGDRKGRVFTFPIPTINVTNDIDWDSEVVEGFVRLACKYGIPYFANYVNSDLSPEDALSMCCRLKLDLTELRKRGGGLFGSNPLTGSIGVVTINLPNLGYVSSNEDEFFKNLYEMMVIAKESLEIKRKIIERNTDMGMYPYSANYLAGIKAGTDSYWTNHFSTIGLVGMNECILNLFGYDITTPNGQEFAIKVLNYMRDVLKEFQDETGNVYNLEATPAEGCSYSLAKKDIERYPDIIHAGVDVPYYTNSTQLPVNFTDDVFEYLELNDELQSLYTGGTVLHLYLGEAITDIEVAKKLIKAVASNYKLPYYSLTPTFSICKNHGYISGEQPVCSDCGEETEVWSRVVGYLRPRKNYNLGKQEEAKQRLNFKI